MHVALICIDKPGQLELRKAKREAHLAYIEASGVVEMAGPFLSPSGEMVGSLVILDVARLSDGEDWAEADPYAMAGLFESVEIREWKKVIG
ncbi:YciI family protein [Rhodobacter sp. Har01]|uniref:YciI family protein n=1 Tax=Rhodobacter sp. Har01 TaxID=2883999 RepID=UPI001D078E12|nr:YciI family protein [Rhodobacter sp. Har01]MCB6177889.1 YciI family protein [Rhodobacter sp. Har01]